MPETRDGLPPLERAVSDTLDEWLVRMHGITTSHTHPRDFLAWLRDNDHEVVPAGETPEERLQVAAAGRANAQAAYRCFRMDHEGRLAHAEEAAHAQAALARFRAWLDTDFRFWCSPHGIAARYASDLIKHLDRLVTEEQNGGQSDER